MNAIESAYFLIALFMAITTWWFMLEYFPTPTHSLPVRLAWMSTIGVACAAVAGLLWPVTLLGFILVTVVTNDA